VDIGSQDLLVMVVLGLEARGLVDILEPSSIASDRTDQVDHLFRMAAGTDKVEEFRRA
jgi:hypothetical protein